MHGRNRLPCLLFVVVLLAGVSACNVPPQVVATREPEAAAALPAWTQTPVSLPSVTAVAPTSNPTSTPSPTATDVPTATPSPTPVSICPEPSTTVSAGFAYPADRNELQATFLEFLNAGGQWPDLMNRLDELEIEHDMVQADVNGDGVLETAVYVRLVEDYNSLPDNNWWIFQCATNEYSIIYDSGGGAFGFHKSFIADDLNDDGRAEIIAVVGFAGSACSLHPQVWSWRAGSLVDLLPDHELELGCQIDRILLEDLDGDNVKEMIMIGGTIGHMDSAPVRGITQTFRLEDTEYRLASTVFAPAELRVHVLDDAQGALDADDIALAVLYYTQAAYEDMPTVESRYLYLSEKDYHPTSYQKAFALFRLAIILHVMGDFEGAGSAVTTLNQTYLEGQPGHEFVLLWQTFFDSYMASENLTEACTQVTEYINEHYNDRTDPSQPTLSSHFYWGSNIAYYGNGARPFCPDFTVPPSGTR